MSFVVDHPLIFLVISLFTLYFSERVGVAIHKRFPTLEEGAREDYTLIVSAALALLGLIIGFTFSMAGNRYDQRKHYEEAEANAIGTEYLRAALLPPEDAARVRALLKNYLGQRILFYETRIESRHGQIDATTARIASDLWSVVEAAAPRRPSAITALAVSGINDVLNAEGYTEAAWLNRVPTSAWILLAIISICCNLLVGYGMHRPEPGNILIFVLPLVVSVSFLLISDIDSPLGGVIRVYPHNLARLAQSLHSGYPGIF